MRYFFWLVQQSNEHISTKAAQAFLSANMHVQKHIRIFVVFCVVIFLFNALSPAMKRLVLIRHAKSSWDDGAISDFDRPLNARGQHDAPRIGAWLREKGITPDLIYSSPAQRALSTARLIAHETGYSLADIITKDILYRFDNELLPIIECVKNSADSAQSIFLFGHNETFTYLANHFTQHRIDHVPTCGVVCFRFAVDTWHNFDKASAALDFVQFPKQLPL